MLFRKRRSDLYLTKDGYLVYNHDSYIDETCNVNGDISLDEVEELCEKKENRHYIENMTLEELEQYNLGYYFEDESGIKTAREVRCGLQNQRWVEVTEGLEQGDVVILN